MGKQSARLYYNGKDHKDIYYDGHYHKAMYLGDQLLWKKLIGGMKWKQVIIPSESSYYSWDIAYGNGCFVHVASDEVAVSHNGLEWEKYTAPSPFLNVSYCNGTFIANSVWGFHTSLDGINWSPIKNLSGTSLIPVPYAKFYYLNGYYFTGSYRSTDLVTAVSTAYSDFSTNDGVTYFNGYYYYFGLYDYLYMTNNFTDEIIVSGNMIAHQRGNPGNARPMIFTAGGILYVIANDRLYCSKDGYVFDVVVDKSGGVENEYVMSFTYLPDRLFAFATWHSVDGKMYQNTILEYNTEYVLQSITISAFDWLCYMVSNENTIVALTSHNSQTVWVGILEE